MDPNALLYQVPGGIISNLISQLKQAEAEERLENMLSCAMFPQVALDFIRRRDDLVVHEIDADWAR